MSREQKQPGREAGAIAWRAPYWDLEGNPDHMAHALRAYAVATLAERLRIALCDQGAKPTWGDLHHHWLQARACIDVAVEATDEVVYRRNLTLAAASLLDLASMVEVMRRPGR